MPAVAQHAAAVGARTERFRIAADRGRRRLGCEERAMTASSVTPPLLPCPFCGSVDIDPHGSDHCTDDGEFPLAVCQECDAAGPPARIWGIGLSYSSDSIADGIANWNRRASRGAEPPEDVADDKKFLEIVEQARKNVAGIVAREEANLVHSHDCAVHLPICRPCSCCLETKLRAENASLRAKLDGPVGEIAAERARQISAEGWTAEHDDRIGYQGALATAAAAYALNAGDMVNPNRDAYANEPPSFWPFDVEWWNPKLPRRDLIRAGALIVAELERLDRIARQSAQAAEGNTK
jgi:hypothetical protein